MPVTPAARTSLAFDAELGQSAFPVRFEGVGRTFTPGAPVLTDVSLEAAAGEVIAILGPSGCGKSTLLRIAAGLDSASEGSVLIDDAPVSGIEPRCAVAFQEPRLLPWRSIADNVALGLPRGTPRAAARAAVDELLSLVGLTAHARSRPREVSGGMAQRASLARALAGTPACSSSTSPSGRSTR